MLPSNSFEQTQRGSCDILPSYLPQLRLCQATKSLELCVDAPIPNYTSVERSQLSLNNFSCGAALPQKSGRDLTPKVLANFSPVFPTLGQSASIELLTLKEFHPVP